MENNRNTEMGQGSGQTSGAGMPGRRTVKQWVLFGIAIFTVLFMVIGLAFPVAHFEVKALGTTLAETTVLGFNFLGGPLPQALESVATALSALVWLQLIATVVCLVLTILSVTKFDRKKAQRAQIAVMIVCTVFSFIYMIDGIAALSATEISGTTASYALLIVVALLTVGYFICLKVMPENIASKSRQGGGTMSSEDNAIEKIKKYKELYDMGAISEEEYTARKNELLNGKH